jgi:aldehyde:ferredoxin oxidoreductase
MVFYHDPASSMAATYATGVRGACHLESLAYWRGYGIEYPGWQEGPHDRLASPGAAGVAIAFQDYFGTYNPLGLCKFIGKTGLPPADVARFVGVATGWDITGDELLTTGARIFNLKRLINNRYGIGREDAMPRIPTHLPVGGRWQPARSAAHPRGVLRRARLARRRPSVAGDAGATRLAGALTPGSRLDALNSGTRS